MPMRSCKAFTPDLSKFYNEHREAKKFEFIFASADNNEAQFKEYFKTMPFLSLPYESKVIRKLSAAWNVGGYPTLVLIDGKTGEVITKKGREGVGADVAGTNFPWKPKVGGAVTGGGHGGARGWYLDTP